MDLLGWLIFLVFLYGVGLAGAIIVTALASLTGRNMGTKQGGTDWLRFLLILPVSVAMLFLLSSIVLEPGGWQSFGLAVFIVSVAVLTRLSSTDRLETIRRTGEEARYMMDEASDAFLRDLLDQSRR